MKTLACSLFSVLYARFTSTLIFLLINGSIVSSQTLYIGTSGGFEMSSVVENTVYSTAQRGKWVKESSNATISKQSTCRSGSFSLSLNNTSSTYSRCWAPVFIAPADGIKLTIQYYRYSTSTVNSQKHRNEISKDGTTSVSQQTAGSPTVIYNWEKITYSPTYSSYNSVETWAAIGHNILGTGSEIFIDDVCIYEGGEDNSSPNSPTSCLFSTTASSSINVSWSAPVSGVDGGGYLVVRGSSDPATAPNVNGIYEKDNLIGSGTVVYQGTSTAFTDTGLSPETIYYYRIYTYDKAYNYSSALTGNQTTPAATLATDYFRSKSSGEWSTQATWQSSPDNVNWIDATLIPSTSATSIVIRNTHTVDLSSNLSTTNLTVDAGATLNVNPDKQLSVSALTNNGTITLKSDATGTATVIPQTISGNGTYRVQQYLSNEARNWYITSPVSNGSLPLPGYFFDESVGNWSALQSVGTSMTMGKGFAVVSPGESTISFNGTINHVSGINLIECYVSRTETQATRGFNLVGNPFPAYIDWSSVIALASNNAIMETTIWYRTKKTDGSYTFATYNATGDNVVSNGANTTITKYIPPMQAYWVRLKPNGSNTSYNTLMDYAKDMRCHRTDAGNTFKAPAQITKQLLRLTVSNGSISDEMLFCATPDAINEKDDYDSPKMMNNSADVPEIYSVSGSEKLVINGMNSFPLNAELALGFVPGKAGAFSINASELTNLAEGVSVWLKDRETGSMFDLSKGDSYTFSSENKPTEDRFSVIFKSAGAPTAIDQKSAKITVFVQNGREIVVSGLEKSHIKSLNLFTLEGKELPVLYSQNSGYSVLNTLITGVYLIKIVTDSVNLNCKVTVKL